MWSDMLVHYIVEGVLLVGVVALYWWAFKEEFKDDDYR